MPPNLSFERLALVLALAGCSKATPASDTSTAVRSDPSAAAQVQQQGAAPPPSITASAAAPITGGRGGAPGGNAASARPTDHDVSRPKMGNPTGQASCGAGSCTSDIKKK